MILRRCYADEQHPQVVAEEPGLEAVTAALASTDWNRLAFLTLERDEKNRLEGSGSINPVDGLCLILLEDGVEHVSETAPPDPQAMLPAFNAYLQGNVDYVFRVIVDADARGLSDEQVAEIRRGAAQQQERRSLEQVLADASSLFTEKRFAEYIAAVEPYEESLGAIDRKKLELARKKAS